MAQNVAVVRATLSATLNGTTDFTSSGFGTASAALIVLCAANTTNNPADSAGFSVGFWDGTNQRACAIGSNDAVSTTSSHRGSDDSYGALVTGSGTAAYSVSAITDGIRLELLVDNTSVQRYATVILLSGISAKALTFTPNSTVNSTAASASLGFAPKLVFFTSIGATTADNALTTANAILSFGFAEVGGAHRMLGYGSVTSAADAKCTIGYSETRCVGQIYNDTETWTGEITTWGADTFTMTTRTGGSGSDVCFALALGGADISYDVGTLTTPTSTGVQVNATDIAPAALLLMASTATSTSLQTTTDGASGFAVGMATDTTDFSHNYYDEDAAATTNTGSVASTSTVLDLDSSSGSSRTDVCVATVAFDSDSFDLDFTTVDATARKGWWVVFGAGSSSLDITATLGTATASGFSASVDRQLGITASLGVATASGFPASIDQQATISASLGVASASGLASTVDRQLEIAATLGTANALGFTADIVTGGDLNINASLGIATASGLTANVDRQLEILASIGTALADGFNATIDTSLTISASLGQATAAGFQASIDRQNSILASLGIASASGFNASVSFDAPLSLSPADLAAIADAVWAHPEALTVAKFLGLK